MKNLFMSTTLAISVILFTGSASAQIPGTFVGATAGVGGNTSLVGGGEFATASGSEEGMWLDGSNTTGDSSRSLRTADGTAAIPDSGGFKGTTFFTPQAVQVGDSQIVTVISGLTPNASYDVNVIYTSQWGHSDLALAAGLTTTTTQVEDRPTGDWPFGSWLDEGSEYNPSVGGSGPNSAARVWNTYLGVGVADGSGNLSVYVDHLTTTQFLSPATAYNGVSYSAAVAPPLLGDVNLDGAVNFLDISPFIAVLSAGLYQAEADCNEDSFVNFLDISPFISILSNQ